MARRRRGRSYAGRGRRHAYKAGLRAGKRKARRQMSRFQPMMQRLGNRR